MVFLFRMVKRQLSAPRKSGLERDLELGIIILIAPRDIVACDERAHLEWDHRDRVVTHVNDHVLWRTGKIVAWFAFDFGNVVVLQAQ